MKTKEGGSRLLEPTGSLLTLLSGQRASAGTKLSLFPRLPSFSPLKGKLADVVSQAERHAQM